MSDKILSVCIITYNHEKYIRQAIEGVLMQRMNFSWEIIIADDFSTDNTRKILIEYKEKYPKLITLILQKKNVGAFKNWRDLMAFPKSKYIAYLESDDYWIGSLKLQKQVDFLKRNQTCTFCFHKAFKSRNEVVDFDNPYPKNIKQQILDETLFFEIPTIHTGSIVFRNNVRFLELNHSHGDFIMYCEFLSNGKAGFINETMSVYRLHEEGVSYKYNSNTYLEKRIKELIVEKQIKVFNDRVRSQVDKIVVSHVLHYLNKNRGNLTLTNKKRYIMKICFSSNFYNRTLKEYCRLFKTILS